MNVRCPSCQTVFRVDPDKVPAAGVRARCSRCTATFRIERPAARAEAAAEPLAAAPAPAPVGTPPSPFQPVAATAPATVAAPMAAPAAAATPASTGPRRASFRNQDPASRAQRIARALVSDIVAYNKDKLQESLGAGTLRTDFREEIRKSWEEYVGQVGLELAKGTPFFRDSLNEILAKGQKIF